MFRTRWFHALSKPKILTICAVLLLFAATAWMLIVSPALADIRFRGAFQNYAKAHLALMPWTVLEVATKTQNVDAVARECGTVQARFWMVRDAIAKLDAFHYGLRGPGKRELAERLIDNATKSYRAEHAALDAVCDVEFVTGPRDRRISLMIEHDAASAKASNYDNEVAATWSGLDTILYATPFRRR